jgi:hypothetical protein
MDITPRERIALNVHVEPSTKCWEWALTIDANGYGVIRVEGKTTGTHRASYEAFVGSIPDGLSLDHLCRNRSCCNPEHLEPVTPKENSRRGATAQKTECKQGHPFTLENTRFTAVNGSIRRSCRECSRQATRRYLERKQNQ